MGTIGTESAFEVTARARALEAQGHSIIHLQIGEPDFDTPANVRAAAKAALDAGATHYPPFAGIPALREALEGRFDHIHSVWIGAILAHVCDPADALEGMRLAELLAAGHRIGPAAVRRLLAQSQASERTTFGSLTERQRGKLALALRIGAAD